MTTVTDQGSNCPLKDKLACHCNSARMHHKLLCSQQSSSHSVIVSDGSAKGDKDGNKSTKGKKGKKKSFQATSQPVNLL